MQKDTQTVEKLSQIILQTLDDMKAKDIVQIDMQDKVSWTDKMIIASAGSDRQVKAIANQIYEDVKNAGFSIPVLEGVENGEWALVDLIDVVVHIMQSEAREYYQIEQLWQAPSKERMKQFIFNEE